eukprot:Seg703.7 transcript_id=Seg703.7/GoldUCD/mRNA.D3Y31 product="hypothetical protein" protein_id=Seg703.7/GoldUCD/D3Y31
MSAIGLLAMVSFDTVNYVNKAPKEAVYTLFAMGIVGYFSAVSAKLVVVIGIERLIAIKLPLKHRLWHTTRKTIYKRIIASWVVTFTFVGLAYLVDYVIQKSKGQTAMVSSNLAYALAAYLTLGAGAVFVTYAWLSNLVINRSTPLLKIDKMDYKRSPKATRKAARKENATIIICRLVAATYLVCNIPIIVALYRGYIDSVSSTLFDLNPVINPLIYFFKGYAEKQYAKKRIASANGDKSAVKDKKSDDLKIETNGTFNKLDSKENDQQPESAKDGGEGQDERPQRILNTVNSSLEMNTSNKVATSDSTTESDPKSDRSKVKGEGSLEISGEEVTLSIMDLPDNATRVNNTYETVSNEIAKTNGKIVDRHEDTQL